LYKVTPQTSSYITEFTSSAIERNIYIFFNHKLLIEGTAAEADENITDVALYKIRNFRKYFKIRKFEKVRNEMNGFGC